MMTESADNVEPISKESEDTEAAGNPEEVNVSGSALKAQRFIASLKWQQKLIYRQDKVASYFEKDSDVLHVLENCWEQIHGRVGDVIDMEYQHILEEFNVLDKLSKLEREEEEHQSSNLAWRPSRDPEENVNQVASVVLRTSGIPELEEILTEVQGVTDELQGQIKDRQRELLDLEKVISDKIEELSNSESDL